MQKAPPLRQTIQVQNAPEKGRSLNATLNGHDFGSSNKVSFGLYYRFLLSVLLASPVKTHIMLLVNPREPKAPSAKPSTALAL